MKLVKKPTKNRNISEDTSYIWLICGLYYVSDLTADVSLRRLIVDDLLCLLHQEDLKWWKSVRIDVTRSNNNNSQ